MRRLLLRRLLVNTRTVLLQLHNLLVMHFNVNWVGGNVVKYICSHGLLLHHLPFVLLVLSAFVLC